MGQRTLVERGAGRTGMGPRGVRVVIPPMGYFDAAASKYPIGEIILGAALPVLRPSTHGEAPNQQRQFNGESC